MNNLNVEIDKIVSDLMEIDSSLKPDQIRLLVARLLEEKPQVVLDENFRHELRSRLLAEIEKVQSRKTNFNFMNKFKYTLSAVGAIAVVALIFVSLPKNQGSVLLPGKQQITRVSDNAFGSLATLTVAGGRGQGGGGGLGGDTAAMSAVPPQVDTKMATPGMGGGSSESLIYQPTNYKFLYKGEEFSIDTDKMAVYEREKGFGSSVNLETILSNFNLESFNISKFGNARLDYITATQDQDNGYTLNLDLRQGTVYIGQNWEKWPNVYATCMDEACYQQNRIKIEELPSDDSAINIANQFMDEFGIDRSVYGTPFVQDMWRIEYERMASTSSMPYVPEALTVVYPTKIEGNEIYDQGGIKTGVYVSIDVRQNRVSSVGELNSQRYQASDYPTEKDTTRIISIAESGGYQNYYGIMEAGAKTETVELGNPTTGYVRLWQYTNNQSKEMFVPSLIFPVTNAPATFYSKNVIVPIVKEVLDSQNNGGGVPRPLMMDKAI